MSTCGAYLSQFALSIQAADAGIYDHTMTLLSRYFNDTLQTSFVEILMDGIRVDSHEGPQPGLKTIWASRQANQAVAVFGSDGQYRGQRTYAYHRNRRLWVTCHDRGLLARPDAVTIDSWSNCESLPAYIDVGESEAKTSIIIPLQYGGRVFGVVVLEFADCIDATDTGKQELSTIVDALARIIWLHETTETQSRDTQTAFSLLEETFGTTAASPLKKRSLFFASPADADDDVVGVIRSVLDEFSHTIDVVYWKRMSKAGEITQQILNAILASSFGICYFSEVMDKNATPHCYRDNSNVLFEAGMLQALTSDPNATPIGWIPVREEEDRTGRVPFDFRVERMIVVPRDGEGNLAEESFRDILTRHVRSLVETT